MMRNTTGIIIAFISGAVAGLAAGILFAPQKGSETRRKIADSSKHLADDIVETYEDSLCALEDLKDMFLKTGRKNGNGNGHGY